MKSKIALILGAVAIPITAVLRILQYTFVIDADGYFSTATTLGKALSFSLYGIYAVVVVAALVLLVSRDRFSVRYSHLSRSIVFRIICFLLGVVLLYESGYRFGAYMRAYEQKFDWLMLFGLLTAIYFVLLAVTKKTGFFSALFGLFPPVYICARGITEFFASFEKAQVSESKLELLSICALALFTVTLCIMHAGVSVKEKRTAALSMAVCALAAPTSISRIVAIAMKELATESIATDVVWAVIQILLIALAVTVLIRIQTNIYIEEDYDDDSGDAEDDIEESIIEEPEQEEDE